MKQKLLRLLALVLCLALLAGCGVQEAADGLPESAAQPEQSETEGVAAEPEEPEEPKDPPYTGPLYEISVGAVQDKLPDFCGISTELHGRGSKLFFFSFCKLWGFCGI